MTEQLYDELIEFFRRYVEIDEKVLVILILWAVATHTYDKSVAFPILHIQGDFATGKNRILDLLCMLCHKPSLITAPTLSSLFRIIDENKGTLLIDEADSILHSDEIEKILLVGYKKGGMTTRSVQDKEHPKGFKPVTFDVYCPKVLVTREGIQNEALSSRSITIITEPKPKDSMVPDVLPSQAMDEGQLLKRQIEMMIEPNNKGSI